MKLIEIVSCYVTDEVKFSGDFSRLKQSFISNGFKEKKLNDNTWKYTRGAGLAFEFNYNSESLQMNVILKRLNNEHVEIKVGNSGFPFEPLMMKKRFKSNLKKIIHEISENGELITDKATVNNIKQDSKAKRNLALTILLISLAFSVYFSF